MPTYHYVQNQGKLMMQSRENDQKPQFGQFFDNFEVNANFSEKHVSFNLKVIFSTKYINVPDFGLIWRTFGEYLQINIFFQKSGSVTFLPL